jgi:hypothetical protein
MKQKLLIAGVGLAATVLVVVAVLALISQSDQTTGQVSSVDLIEVSPSTDWLTIAAGSSGTGVSPLTLTNNNDWPVTVDTLTVIHSDPQFLGTLTLRLDETCTLAGYTYLLDTDPQVLPLGFTIPATSAVDLCGELDFDMTLEVAATDDLTFVLDSHN